ncbi:MAG: SLC13 family permease, partial [Alphaproteobacteria bacterium]
GLIFVAFLGWRLIPAARRTKAGEESLFEIEAYVTELLVPEESALLGKGRRQVETEFERLEVEFVGLIREHQRIHSATWRGRISVGDILVLEAAPEGIDKVVNAYGLELVGSGAEVSGDLKSDELALVEAVVSPAGMIENRTASGIRLRGRFGVNLLAVSRQGRPIRTRLHTMRLRAGDVLLLQGPVDQMPTILNDIGCLPLAERGLRIGRPERAWLSLAVFVAAIVFMSLGLVAAPIALSLAAMAMLFLNVASLREAYDSINWPVIVLLGAMIPIGGALESTGATDLITEFILDIGNGISPVLVLTILLIVTMTLSDIVNNAATAVIMAPIAVGLAERLQVNADAFLMAVAIGASCAFLTPIGHQNNTLILGPGGYRFGDYWRMGLPLEILIVAVSIPMILWVWPLG